MTKFVPGSVVICKDNSQVPELRIGTRYLVEKVRTEEILASYIKNGVEVLKIEHLTMIVLKGSNCSYKIERFELETDPDIIRGFMEGVEAVASLVKSIE